MWESPVEAIVEPLSGNWTELERAAELLTQLGDARARPGADRRGDRAGRGFMVSTFRRAVDKIATAIGTGWVPFAGWYKVYDRSGR